MPAPTKHDFVDSLQDQAELLDLASDAIFVRDLAGVLLYWNRGAERLYGWTRSEALGRVTQDLLQCRYPCPLTQIERQVLTTGAWEGEVEHAHRDGHWLTVSSRWVLRRSGQGRPSGMLESNTDVTEPRAAERALRESEGRFRTLLEATPDALVLVNERGQITFCNRLMEEMFGYRATELAGQEIELLLPQRFRQIHREQRTAYVAAPRARPIGAGQDLFGLCKNGCEIPVEISLSPLHIGGELVVLAAVRDISERKRAEAAARRLQALELAQAEHLATLGEIAAGLAHEIKNPLAGIAAALEVLAPAAAGPQEIMSEVRQQVQRIRRIIDDLLHYARPHPPQMEPGNLNLAVTQAVHLAAHAAAGRGIQVILTPLALPPLLHDPEQMQRLVANLVFNAIDAVADGGLVEVRVLRRLHPEPAAVIEVRDNGKGIAPDALPQLFRPFYTTKGNHGNGLGLPLCQQIAQMHGGRVEVESRVSAGSVFTVVLPWPAPAGAEAHA